MPTLTTSKELPKCGCFVLCNDRFMSGWGYARHKINTVVLYCETLREAKTVAAQAQKRTDQTHIRIYAYRKPRLNFKTHCYSYHTKEDYSNWYDPNHNWR